MMSANCRVAYEMLTGASQLAARPAPLKKYRAKSRFEHLNSPADRRLRDIRCLRRAPKAPVLSDEDSIF